MPQDQLPGLSSDLYVRPLEMKRPAHCCSRAACTSQFIHFAFRSLGEVLAALLARSNQNTPQAALVEAGWLARGTGGRTGAREAEITEQREQRA